MSLKWSDADEIGYQLAQKYPGVDPLAVRFTQLHEYVVGLAEFSDSPSASNESVLEAIQMAWVEYKRESSTR